MRSARWTERECAVCALVSSSRTTEEAEEEAAVADTEAVEDMAAEEEEAADAEDRVLARALPEDPGWLLIKLLLFFPNNYISHLICLFPDRDRPVVLALARRNTMIASEALAVTDPDPSKC